MGRNTPIRAWIVAGVAPAMLLAFASGGCRSSSPPAVRTAVLMRSDVTYDDIWQATVVAVSSLFTLRDVDREKRYVVSGYEYDEVRGGSYRWKATARIERLSEYWVVRVVTEVELLDLVGWKPVGYDDPTSMWILHRVDEQIFRLRGAPPVDDEIRYVEPAAGATGR